MSEQAGATVPEVLIQELSRTRPRACAVPLISVDQEGYPHVALLSFFEMVWRSGLYFYVGASSRTARFLREQGKCTLLFAAPDFIYYLKGRPRQVSTLERWAIFQLEPTSLLEDRPSPEEAGAMLVSGIRFRSNPEGFQQRLDRRRKILQFLRLEQTAAG